MRKIWFHLKELDWFLIILALFLVGIGLLSIYSSSSFSGNFLNFKKQIIFLLIGFFLMLFFSFFNWRIFRDDPFFIFSLYFLCLFSLAGLFFFAPAIRGIKSWYRLGSITLDPIEPTKLILIILLAKYFSTRHVEMYRIKHILISFIYVLIPAILIFFQPDLGSVLILIAFWLAILIISGIKIGHFLILILCLFLIFIFSWSFLLKEYQKERIISYLQPKLADPLEIGWSQNQAKIAIGSGGVFGQGFRQGSQTRYGFLPEPQTDFIFSAIAEEFGLIGISFLLILFFLLLWRIIKIALLATSNFPRLFASGFAILLLSQIFIHIGMNLGLLPIIGIPLPLVSYGGSGLIATFIGLGILENMKIHQ